MIRRDDIEPTDDQLRAVLGNSGPGWPVQALSPGPTSANPSVSAGVSAGGAPGPDREQRANLLRETLIVAGAGLSSRDERIIQWLSKWEPETVATVADWIARAYVAGQEVE